MPPLASVAIPVISRSESTGTWSMSKGKAPIRPTFNPRKYKDGPLPIKPSEHAPKNAQIIDRNLTHHGVAYRLKISEVEINDVGVDEILDYVSALDLENFENHQFAEEREVLKVVSAEKKRAKQEKYERMKERAKNKGVILYDSTDVAHDETEGGDGAPSRHGRARPTYTHLFKKVKDHKRRKRDPASGGSLSDDDENDEEGQSSSAGLATRPTSMRTATHLEEVPKRRRRKRDRITGELLPLSPVTEQPTELEQKKRQRRRRHPQTGELMPVGWRYDSDHESEMRKAGLGSTVSFRELSISQHHEAKRQRLDTESSMSGSSSPIPTKAQLAAQLSKSTQRASISDLGNVKSKSEITDLMTSDDESGEAQAASTGARMKPLPKPAMPKASHRMLQSVLTTSGPDSSPEPERRTSILHPFVSKAMASNSSIEKIEATPRRMKAGEMSMMNPSAGTASRNEQSIQQSEDSDDGPDDGEWFIEGILAHHMSDPSTHPVELGKKPVMLFQVKWEGWDEPTWEPMESFSDHSVVVDYRRQMGLDSNPESQSRQNGVVAMVAQTSTNPSALPSRSNSPANDTEENDEELEEDEYEIEEILAHHLSDPRTHPPELGKTPVMLYKVKWKGWEEPTWEPSESFGDEDILRAYRNRVGLDEDMSDAV